MPWTCLDAEKICYGTIVHVFFGIGDDCTGDDGLVKWDVDNTVTRESMMELTHVTEEEEVKEFLISMWEAGVNGHR
jgi:hypothetical protein